MLNVKKGFTLVELMIVLVVIGILSAVMMMASDEAVSSARATTIIADLTNLKKALMIWHVDNYDRIQHDSGSDYAGMIFAPNNNGQEKNGGYNPIQETNVMDEIVSRYLDNAKINQGQRKQNTEMSEGSYGIYDGGGTTAKGKWTGLPANAKTGRLAWFVGYRFTSSERDVVRKKLKGRAKTLGLIFSGKYPNANEGEDPFNKNSTEGFYTVWMRVL